MKYCSLSNQTRSDTLHSRKKASSGFIVWSSVANSAILMALVVTILLAFACNPAQAAKNQKYASFVMDADTGLILHQRYADKSLHPASLAKAMTLMLVFDELRSGQLRMHDRVYMSRHAATMIPSKLDIPPGSSIMVEDAIYALVTKSANDVAVALAERVGGTEQRFAYLMTKKAHAIGMTRTRFYNASGLHDPRQVTTARDMAKMGQYLINTYPDYYEYFSTKSFTYKGKTYRNHNRLMSTYKGMDGLKTGYIRASGFNLVASAKRGNRRLIGVVFGGRSSYTRNEHMASILDRGFARLNTVIAAAETNAPTPERKPAYAVQQVAHNVVKISPSGKVIASERGSQQFASLNPIMETEEFSKIIGEGDFDPAEIGRFKTGLMAISAVKNRDMAQDPALLSSLVIANNASVASAKPLAESKQSRQQSKAWAIQVGAFKSRLKTQKVAKETLEILPENLSHGWAHVAPLKTRTGWIFRGRINGFSQTEAERACRYLKDCIPVKI